MPMLLITLVIVGILVLLMALHLWAVLAILFGLALLVALCIAAYFWDEMNAAKKPTSEPAPTHSPLLMEADKRLNATRDRMRESRRQLIGAAADIDRIYDDAKHRMDTQAAAFKTRYKFEED